MSVQVTGVFKGAAVVGRSRTFLDLVCPICVHVGGQPVNSLRQLAGLATPRTDETRGCLDGAPTLTFGSRVRTLLTTLRTVSGC